MNRAEAGTPFTGRRSGGPKAPSHYDPGGRIVTVLSSRDDGHAVFLADGRGSVMAFAAKSREDAEELRRGISALLGKHGSPAQSAGSAR